MIRRLLLLASLCACAAPDPPGSPGPPPTGPAHAERELPLPAGGLVRVEIGDPRAYDGAWTRAAIAQGDALVTRIQAVCFADADGDGTLDEGETRHAYGAFHMGAPPTESIGWALGPRAALEGVDAVRVTVTTTAGEVETVFALER